MLLFCSGGETGRDMSHLEDWREYENLSVSKQLFRGEAILRETNREIHRGWEIQVMVSKEATSQGLWFSQGIDLGQTEPSKSYQRNPPGGLLPSSHTCQNSVFSDLCLNRSHSDCPEPDVIYDKTREVSLETNVRYPYKRCYKKHFWMSWCPVMWHSSHIPTQDPSFTVTRSWTPVPPLQIHLL